ncbi:hypothetical protein OCH239_12870 [Roseivivax halodurans JCM 10272]|uniref:Anti-sigma factor n=1 Tax=Roseivivax halodurans JCM 10272 TaxID=1449350 RepID=X7EAU3_9RHOB|nr:hypothetical protein [Roseivivax halodurans]ETX13209.1 hypothetical protein OCH239_12870 [Roseivivax halodurans JCM 10272]
MTAAWSDEQLTAFLDGALSADKARALERALDAHPALVARLDALTIDMDVLKDAFDGLLVAAPRAASAADSTPAADTKTARKPANDPRAPVWLGMALAASLAVGVVFGSALSGGEREEDWRDLAAAYHLLYAPETLAVVDDNAERIGREIARAAVGIDRDLSLGTLAAPDGLKLKRAQILAFEGRPLAQVAYLTADGQPVALCIMSGEDGSDEAISGLRMRDMAAATWTKGGYGYLLVGGDDASLLEDAAHELSRLL